MKRKWRSVICWLAGLVGLLAATGFAGFRYSLNLLCIDSGAVKGGALVVLGGDPNGRPARAAELFNAHAAPVIVLSGGPGGCEVMDTVLKQHGVPGHAIVWEEHSLNTLGNAECSVAILRKAGISNAIIVTSWYHARRALNCFRKAAPEMTFYSCPTVADRPARGWPNRTDRMRVLLEYTKTAWYWVRYGVSPF